MKPKLPQQIFVSGIGTDVGKTVVSAILVEALQADYWKPVQAGGLNFTDTDLVKGLVSNTKSVFHIEQHALQTASSPHYAARQEGVSIDVAAFQFPSTNNRLIVEGAGGLMVPLNGQHTVIDFVKQYELPVLLVANNYLGSINHSLLSVAALKQAGIPLLGIIFNGDTYLDNAEIIQQLCMVDSVYYIYKASELTKDFVSAEAAKLRQQLEAHYEL